jgi:hypothetical protein
MGSIVKRVTSGMKKALYGLTTTKFRDRLKFARMDFQEIPPILVFQMGKVGSTSICHTLESMDLGRPVYHAHYLSTEGIEKARSWHRHHQGSVPYSIDYYQLLGRKVCANLGKAHYAVITGVRDPIAKEISNYFELADEIDHGLRNDNGSFDIDAINRYLLDRFDRFADTESDFFTKVWFDQELKGTLGIDVFQHPFDSNAGYTIIKSNNVDLLVYQYEKLEHVFPAAVAKLLGLTQSDVPSLARHNVGSQKWYAEVYAEVKERIAVPLEVCRRVYGSKLVTHFYSQQTTADWTRRWSARQYP